MRLACLSLIPLSVMQQGLDALNGHSPLDLELKIDTKLPHHVAVDGRAGISDRTPQQIARQRHPTAMGSNQTNNVGIS